MQIETWSTALNNTFAQLMERLMQYLPNIIGAVVLVIVGWIVAVAIRAIFLRLMRAFETVLQRFSKQGKSAKNQFYSTSQFLAKFVFWIVILFFITAALNFLQLKIISEWLNNVISYLPTLLAGGVIIFVGYLLSGLLKEVILRSNVASKDQRQFLAKTVHVLLVITIVLIGLDQIGIKVTMLVILFTLLVGSVVGGLALAVSLGARFAVSNLIGSHYLRQSYHPGQLIRINNHQGKIVELTPTSLVLETAEGLVALPSKLVHETAVILIEETASDD
ncbi:mechanosensitive ion channel family protein [Kaarinaea lacus]